MPALLPTWALLRLLQEKAMLFCIDGVKTVAIIFLVTTAGGAFKQIPEKARLVKSLGCTRATGSIRR